MGGSRNFPFSVPSPRRLGRSVASRITGTTTREIRLLSVLCNLSLYSERGKLDDHEKQRGMPRRFSRHLAEISVDGAREGEGEGRGSATVENGISIVRTMGHTEGKGHVGGSIGVKEEQRASVLLSWDIKRSQRWTRLLKKPSLPFFCAPLKGGWRLGFFLAFWNGIFFSVFLGRPFLWFSFFCV